MPHDLKKIAAKEIMTEELLSVEPGITVQEATDLMDKNNIGAVVVLSPIKDLLGIFTERDLLRRVVAKKKSPAQTKIREVMTPNVMVAQSTDNAWELLQIMQREKFRHLPVVEGRKVIGIVSLKDFADCLLQS
ncbi:MAG: CBS domain-containing protein [Deltaproteobacteria bacterium]|nr:CBS domain-containing protein [Deltaproteobacteria bacterium]